MPKEFSFNIGADPEFNILLQDKRVSAEKLLKTIFKGTKEGKTEDGGETMGFQIEKNGEIGWDGNTATGELRPKQSKNPAILCDNIEKIFKSFVKKTGLFDITTSSHKAPIGGHIHLELSEELNNATDRSLINIHKKIAHFAFPIIIGENNINMKIRGKNDYGKITDYRVQSFGNKKTYEFRAPSAEWMTSKKLANATISYIGVIWHEITNNAEKFNKKNKNFVIKTQAQAAVLQSIVETGLEGPIKATLKDIKNRIKTFELYDEFKDEINFILSPEKVKKEKEKYGFNVIKGWNLLKDITPKKKDILNETKTKEKAKKLNLDRMMDLIQVNYNKDINVETFAKTLKQKVIVHNWKLKNTYFLFGLKKGLTNYLAMNRETEIVIGKEIIKTGRDYTIVKDIFQKMEIKFANATGSIRTHMTQEDRRKVIFIGIPYEDRIDEKTRDFINLIYKIEKERKAEMIKEDELDQETPGELAKTYDTGEDETTENLDQSLIVADNPDARRVLSQQRRMPHRTDYSEDTDIQSTSCGNCNSTNTEIRQYNSGEDYIYCLDCNEETTI